MSEVADRFLVWLGARPAAGGDLAPRLVDPLPPGDFGAGLPGGTLQYATGVALALGAVAGVAVSGLAVAIQVRLPEVMAAAYGSPFEMSPAPPIRAPGGGWLQADLGAPGDREEFEVLWSTRPESAPAPELARAAQEWRLPVCDYRAMSPGPPLPPWSFAAGPGPAAASLRGLRVLDLTNMWAGPLVTWLLQSLGATVTKVEPAFRPDGFRAMAGGGIHPGGRQCDPGRDSAMWNALNHGKEVVDLDLRRGADRDRFAALARASDVVIDSFSPRVMANFGVDRPEGPLYVSMPAFGPGPERNWVAYGSGIHAWSGLADLGDGAVAPAAVSYPDALAGFTAALAVAAVVRGPGGVSRLECPLAAATQPLAAQAPDPAPLAADPAGTGGRLLALGRERGRFEDRPVCGQPLAHPRGIFPPNQNLF